MNPASLENAEVKAALEKIEAHKPELLNQEASAVSEDTVVVPEQSTTEQSATEGAAGMDFDSLDMQRDMAFKIVYFFIVFIVATFGLLYAYFQMNKKELEEEEQRQAIKHQVRQKGASKADHTFFDFLAGNVDEEMCNPYAMRENLTTKAPSVQREDSGFGSANLESLGEQPVFY